MPGAKEDKSPGLAMRDGPWKLLMQPDGSRLELYNLRTDRAEAVNLAGRETKRAKRMADQLQAWYAALPAFRPA
jgi:hypothetical protein